MANYTYLVNELIAATENDSTEFLNFIPNMTNRAEERLVKDLDDYGLVSYTSVAVSSGTNKITLPTGTRIVKNFNITSNGTKINLLINYWRYITFRKISSPGGTTLVLICIQSINTKPVLTRFTLILDTSYRPVQC